MIKRTPIVDKDDQQLYLDDGLRQYVYWIVVSNSKRSNEQVLRIAQGRGNQENLIKDFKYGLGLAHIALRAQGRGEGVPDAVRMA